MQPLPIKNKMPMLKGSYTLTKLVKKPRWISVRAWLVMFKLGLLNWAIIRQTKHENKIMLDTNYGMQLFFQHLGGLDTYPLELSSAAIGTGTTAPTDTDHALETPVLTGIPRATVDIGLDYVLTEWFITDDELANGTYNEFGLYCGTQLFCRSIISPAHSKASNEDTLIQYTISGDNAI